MKEEYYEEYRRIGLKISYYRKLKGITQGANPKFCVNEE